MMRWIKLVIITLSIGYLASSQVIGQQTNPFDIIITDESKLPKPSDTSVMTEQSDNGVNDSTKLTTTVAADNQATAVDELQGNEPAKVVYESNPFNIKKSSDKKDQSSTNAAVNNAITNPAPKAELESTNKSSWFTKLKPRRSSDQSIDYSLNFIFWILIASLLILAVVINLKRKSFLNLYRAITNDNYLKLLQREEYNGSSFFFLLLYFLFFLNAALFLYQLLINKFEIKGYQIFLYLFGALLLIYLIRLIATFGLQITFPLEKEAKQYNFTVIMFNIIVGLLLIPINILIAYAPFGQNMIYVGLGIVVLFYGLRQIRGLFIAARIKGLSYFHFFIYLCTFEVAPIFWIISVAHYWYSGS